MNIVDLTQNINESMPVYPGTEQPVINNATTIKKDGFAEKLITIYSHTGTHIDAPAHMLNEGLSLDHYPIDKFIGKATVVDCKSSIITKDLILKKIEKIENIEFIILCTGWSMNWGKDDYFYNFPILDDDASTFISQLGLKGVGLDCISIDEVGSREMNNHIKMFNNNMIIIENLCNLNKLIDKEFIFSCMPLKIDDADGSPTRAVGITD